MSDHDTTVAVGGQRRVPIPDAVAHDYLLLGLRLDQHVPGLVDGYFGPAELKARADIEELRPRRLGSSTMRRPSSSGSRPRSPSPIDATG